MGISKFHLTENQEILQMVNGTKNWRSRYTLAVTERTSGGTEGSVFGREEEEGGGRDAGGGVEGGWGSCMGAKSTSLRTGSQQTMSKIDKMRNSGISIFVKDREITTKHKTEVKNAVC